MGEIGPTFPAWARLAAETAKHHGVDLDRGLSEEQVAQQRAKYGWNELAKQPGKPLWRLVLEQFDDMLVKVLLMAAMVSFLLAYFEESSSDEGIRAYIEPAVILLILVLNAIVGVWQESNAEAALDALKEMQADSSTVLRNGQMVSQLPSRELVPGDVVELHAGDRVPADLRIVAMKTATLRAEQSSLTGESVAVNKGAAPVEEEGCELQAKDCMLFAATAVANGSCRAVVNSVGMATEVGAIQQQIADAAAKEEDTPLKKKLDKFGETLAQVIFYICVLVWLINYHHFLSWQPLPKSRLPDLSTLRFSLGACIYYFKIAVALAVAAIPEGLPAVITTCLALGTRKMAKRNAIVRKLPSVETLGCTTVICSDKTGTLTTNQMSALRICALGSRAEELQELEVEGTSFNPGKGGVAGLMSLTPNLEALAEVCAVCNDARIEARNGVFRAAGAPTEAALVVLAEKLGVPDAEEQARILAQRGSDPDAHADGASRWYHARLRKLATLEFDRDRKSMGVICTPGGVAPIAAAAAGREGSIKANGPVTRRAARTGNSGGGGGGGGGGAGGNVLLVKGAAETLLARCDKAMLASGKVVPLDERTRRAILAAVDRMAAGALRCLACAHRRDLGDLATYDGDQHPGHRRLCDAGNYAEIESGLTWLGVAGLQDPPRGEVRGAIQQCSQAGIRVVVITGDNKLTAEAICRQIGVFGPDDDLSGRSLTGRSFAELPLEERRAILKGPGGLCFSRAEPRHKQDVVRLLREMGEVAAMTGDGVNDAPALKLADIGIAMGITGTEVAKEAADMVLADDNFSTIVAAVEEGRAIYNNMKAFIRYMISSNIGEVACIFFTAALGLPENLIPVQLLWVNLVTDGPPATALGFNPPDVDIMQKPPRRADEELVTPWLFFRWMVVGGYVGVATVGVFAVWYLRTSFLGIDLSGDGHTPVTLWQLRHWETCPSWDGFKAAPYTAGGRTLTFEDPCDYFRAGKAKASTLSLSVLVAIEMFNALNALSEDNSLLQMPPWSNPWLLAAMALSFGLHFVILYVPALASVFSIVPLSLNEWALVLLFAAPVVLIDEVLKLFGRQYVNRRTSADKPAADARLKEETGINVECVIGGPNTFNHARRHWTAVRRMAQKPCMRSWFEENVAPFSGQRGAVVESDDSCGLSESDVFSLGLTSLPAAYQANFASGSLGGRCSSLGPAASIKPSGSSRLPSVSAPGAWPGSGFACFQDCVLGGQANEPSWFTGNTCGALSEASGPLEVPDTAVLTNRQASAVSAAEARVPSVIMAALMHEPGSGLAVRTLKLTKGELSGDHSGDKTGDDSDADTEGADEDDATGHDCVSRRERRARYAGGDGSGEVPRGLTGEVARSMGGVARRACLQRYRAKKARRLFTHTVRYAARKANADRRPRVKGRFVKASELAAFLQAQG
ncbi:hypothetical protein WJX81_007349 [Elliptochloris bilobata]|uniref:P-type Ca(2+) transporter n=1 Tax=Elliptochloris bilobata TaxID=381761 RepID=A0AAW1S1N0_9CHLO